MMPIKDPSRYPDNWKEIRQQILKRADNRCEFCGVKNHIFGCWQKDDSFYEADGCELDVLALDGHKTIQIVLTIAHMDHTPENNDPSNLRALCQRCHNRYDVDHRKQTRFETKRQKEKASGQQFLFERGDK